MTKIIKGSLDEIIEIIDDLKDSIFDWDEHGIRRIDEKFLRTALAKFVFDWNRTCDCHEMDRHGETFCCNHCGRPVTNQSYLDKTPVVIYGEPLRTTPKKGGDDGL